MTFVTVVAHLIEFFIIYLFFNTVFSPKRKQTIIIAGGIASYCVVLVVFLFLDSTVVNILAGIIYNFLFGLVFYRCSIKESVFSALFLSASLTASEFIVMAVVSLGNNGDIEAFKTSILNYSLSVLFSKTIYLIIVQLIASLIPIRDRTRKIPAFLFLFPLSATIVLYILWMISTNYSLTETTHYTIVVAACSIVISILLTYVFYVKTTKELNELYNQQIESERIAADEAYYEILDKQNDQLKTIIHDEKNHLAAIKSIANNPEVSEYIDGIYGQIIENSLFGNTKNKVLDLIINKYQYICNTENIDFYVSIRTSNLIQIEKTDLVSLMGNLLDNAVEAAKKSKSRKIDLLINKANGFDIITCTNSCDYRPETVGNDLKTTKKEAGFHGLGIKRIKQIVDKYNGNFKWDYDETDKEFSVWIMI